MDAVIEVKGSTSTVDISWDEKSKGGVADAEKRTSDQIMDSGKMFPRIIVTIANIFVF